MSDAFEQIGSAPAVVSERAAAVLAQDAQGRILCQLRDDFAHVAARGKWSLFGGKVETGESLHEAAQREFFEETGLRVEATDLTAMAKIASTVKPDWEIYIFALATEVDPADVRLGEGAGFAFLTPAQIAEMDFIETYTRFFEKFFHGTAAGSRI
ncbi:NUDIX hydrolase [Lentibacter algarum]|uniref:NUDIX domain-containing protein n=1 Tax=Lentibacter algarum TaxID=576131 RepID=UPI001C074EDF|nr:NUDIX hydrolase [Lentibacter algarum]MBU2981885.1 NUDIX hydrolase [Lentibacter algarum]